MRFLARAQRSTRGDRGSTKDKDQEYMPADGNARRSTSGLRHPPLAAHRTVTRLGAARKRAIAAAERSAMSAWRSDSRPPATADISQPQRADIMSRVATPTLCFNSKNKDQDGG